MDNEIKYKIVTLPSEFDIKCDNIYRFTIRNDFIPYSTYDLDLVSVVYKNMIDDIKEEFNKMIADINANNMTIYDDIGDNLNNIRNILNRDVVKDNSDV